MSDNLTRPGGVVGGTLFKATWYLTTTEAAEELGVTRRAVVWAIQKGRILSVQVEHEHLIEAGEVARYRDNRRPSRGHTREQLEATRRDRDIGQRRHSDSTWKGTAVYYRHHDGRETRIDVTGARMLALLHDQQPLLPLSHFADIVHDLKDAPKSRTAVTTRINRLIQTGFIVPTVGRDRHGGRIRFLHLGTSGRDALIYCKDRGLI